MKNIKECKCTGECECQVGEQMSELICELEHDNSEAVSEDLMYHEEEFGKGVYSASFLLGQVMTLQQAGLTNEEVISLITLQATIQSEKDSQLHERNLLDLSTKTQIKCEEIKAQSELLNDLMND